MHDRQAATEILLPEKIQYFHKFVLVRIEAMVMEKRTV